jgi:hypothetical protein
MTSTNELPGETAESLIKSVLKQRHLTKKQRRAAPKHQLILDQALEDQFEEILDLFDVYVNNVSLVDQRKFRQQEFNKIKLELDMKKQLLLQQEEQRPGQNRTS